MPAKTLSAEEVFVTALTEAPLRRLSPVTAVTTGRGQAALTPPRQVTPQCFGPVGWPGRSAR